MNRLVENGLMQQIPCGSDLAYVLNYNSLLVPAEYDALQSQSGTGLARCVMTQNDGRMQLTYPVSGLRPLSGLLPVMPPDHFLLVVKELLAGILQIRGNGALSFQNLELSLDKVFVDPRTLKVSLVYLPLLIHLFDEDAAGEALLRSELVRTIGSFPGLTSPATTKLAADLSNADLSLEALHGMLRSVAPAPKPVQPPTPPQAPRPVPEKKPTIGAQLRIVSVNAPTQVEIRVTKAPFVLGKNPSIVDGVLSFNKMISRVHCRIDQDGTEYTITDLQSANGTYVNRVKLQPDHPHPIKNGDIIRLANSDFKIVISE